MARPRLDDSTLGRPGDADSEDLVERVLRRANDRRALAQKTVPAFRAPRYDLPRHDAHVAPDLARELGGDQASGSLGGLDDHREAGEAGHDPVARGKAPPQRLVPGRKLR